MKYLLKYVAVLATVFFLPVTISAKADISILENDITFSKDTIFAGDTVKIYARVFNQGDVDISGFIVFVVTGKEIGTPQPISVKPNTYDDVFINWQPLQGNYVIEAKVINTNPKDENLENNNTAKKDVLVDLDTDRDGIGDSKDEDIDNDGISNEEEKSKSTDPRKKDTDGDGVADKVDIFPLDKTEWRDTNGNGVGDNADPDADSDTLSNEEEIYTYGTNPLNPDSDGDGLSDGQETASGTDPNNPDSKNKGIQEYISIIPFNPSKWQANLKDSIWPYLVKNKTVAFWGLGLLLLLIILFLFRRRRKRR